MSWDSTISALSPAHWWKFDGNTNDSGSQTAWSFSTVGTPNLGKISQIANKCAYLPSNAGYYSTTANSATIFDDRSFTIEGWIRIPVVPSTWGHIFRADVTAGSGSGQEFALRFRGEDSGSTDKGKLHFYWLVSGTTYQVTGTSNICDNKWHHVAVTVNGTEAKIYVDGSQQSSTLTIATTTTYFDTTNSRKQIGALNDASYGINGYLDELVMHTTTLSAAQIDTNYKEVILSYPNRILSLSPEIYFPFDEASGTPTNVGNSANSAISSTNGSPTANNASTISNTSYSFDGNDGYRLDTGSLNSNVFGDGTFSVEAWVKTSSSSGIQEIFQMGVSTNSNATFDAGWALRLNVGKPQFYYIGKASTTFTELTHGSTISDGNWHHLVGTVKTTSGNYDIKLYLDGSLIQSDLTNSTTTPGANADGVTYSWKRLAQSINNDEYFIGNIDELAIYSGELTSTQITDNYNARAIHLTYTSAVMTVTTSTLPMPVISAIKNVNYSDTASTASALAVDPTISTNTNLDAFGVATASALLVDPAITVAESINNSVDPATASANSPDSTVSTTRSVNVSADPATASALLSSNFYGGTTGQDTSYSLTLRELVTDTGANTNASGGFEIGRYKNNSTITLNQKILLIIPSSGLPEINKIVKVKFDSAHVSALSTNDIAPNNRFNIYKATTTINNPTTTTFDSINKTLLYTTRLLDDSTDGNSNFYLDLTPAFADSQAYANGVLIESFNDGTSYDGWDETVFSGSNLNQHLLYILASGLINKNVNADPMTASSLSPDSAIATQRYVNVSADPFTASADIVNPQAGVSDTFTALPATASALAVQPTFLRTVEFPHTFATAHSDIVNPTLILQGTNNYVAEPATAEALFHMPQFGIGENNSVDHMNATALFVMPTLIIPESVDAMTTTASATMVQPTATLQLLGAVSASPMTASTDIINPPAYVNLFADKWYDLLYTQHSRPHGVRTLNGGNGESILKLFADVSVNKTIGSTVNNNLPTTIVSDGVVVANEQPVMNVSGEFVSSNPPLISTGYFDNLSRKAVRFNNITIGTENSEVNEYEFTFEMSIKTTKADQIIAFGRGGSFYGSQRRAAYLGLTDGKLFIYNTQTIGRAPILHYKELGANQEYVSLGNKNIADGQWHHIIVQNGFGDGRTQYWIDGELDLQTFNIPRTDAFSFLGHSTDVATYASDFYTSAWSLDSHRFISEQEVDNHYFAYTNFEPVRAEPMVASLTAPNGATGKGNRKRALMLYFWPTSPGQNTNLITKRFTDNTFDSQLETRDFINQPPQQYYGWDVFPVDITGYFVSDLVKEEAYGGARNIILQNDSIADTSPVFRPQPMFKVNRKGYFRNTLTDTARYINLTEDIDLSQFDAIFFKNYPDESVELDSYARNEVVDAYFNLRETVIFGNFLKSLRAAVDTGISLMVTNPQLAIDLKIVDRIDVVPDLMDTGFYYSDPYTPTIVPASYEIGTTTFTANLWNDTFKNNRIRLINTFPGITDQKCINYVRGAKWNNDDSITYGNPDRVFHGYEIKPNGLSVGDEWYLDTFTASEGYPDSGISSYLATPIANVKCGTPITAFANQYRQGLNLVDNPYKNYVTSIAIKPGDVLDGKQVAGKIWVNFTDLINLEDEYIGIDAIHPDFINLAYTEGTITLAERNAYLADPNIQTSPVGELTANTVNKGAFWQSNGEFILTQGNILENKDGLSDFSGTSLRKGTTRKTNKAGLTSAATTSFGGQFFTFTYARQYAQLVFERLSMNTRGFRWIGDRADSVAQSQAHTATIANATMVQPVVIPGKQVTVVAQAMLSSAEKVSAVGFAGANRIVITLPLEASAKITEPSKVVIAAPMTSSVLFSPNYAINTTATDQVVLYVLHEDPILYLREDIIK